MKAIIMAGGEGSRLRPLTCDCPKPMVRLMEKPVMEYTVNMLAHNGITEIAATLGYLPQAVTDHFGDGSSFGVHLRYYIEREPLGTAGGIAQAKDFLTDTFVVLSGDGITDLDIMEAVAFHRARRAEATLVLRHMEDPLEYGVVVTGEDGRVLHFHEKPGWGEVLSDTVNTGIYILEPSVLKRIPAGATMDFGRQLFPQMVKEGCRIYGYLTGAYWCDIGDISAYLQVHYDAMDGKINLPEFSRLAGRAVKEPGAVINHSAVLEAPCYIAPGAHIHAGAHVGAYTVIGRGAVLLPGANTKRAVLWPGAQLMRGAQARGCVLAANSLLCEGAQAFEDCALGTGSAAGARACLSPGVKLWPGKLAANGQRCDSNLVWGSRKKLGFWAGVLPITSPADSTRIAQACAGALKPRELLLGRRPSPVAGAMWHAFVAGLMAQGVQVIDAGICSLPQLRYMLGVLHCDTAALAEDDRLVVLNGDGVCLRPDQQRSINALLYRQDYSGPFCGTTPPILSAGRTEIGYIANLAACFQAQPSAAPDIALYCSNSHALSLCEQAFVRTGLNVRTEWEREMMDTAPGEIGVWLEPGSEGVNFQDEHGMLTEEQRQMLICWVALATGETKLLLPQGYTDGAQILARRKNATVEYVQDEPAAWMRQLAHCSQHQFRLHFDGVYLALSAISALTSAGLSLAAWRNTLPVVHRRTTSVSVAPAMRGHILSALAKAMPENRLGGGIRIAQPHGWAWVSMDESSGCCRVVSEGQSAEFADELCSLCADLVRRAGSARISGNP